MRESKKKQSNNVRIKEQKLEQNKYEISRSDCDEFIRVVKKYEICERTKLFGSSFNRQDLIEYCKLNEIPLNEQTIDCMFEELFLNNRNTKE
ncbi:conserved Plasmodium protein, unknown function [Plasmodium malariae]|uniref:Uncharacterized protein n=2 Tax=Plasmodium (Plasmodium) TaxID=418103 RepID=A0A1A8X3W1_PLAMA|nr:conserved Plasmodium protein, unknown function [Plasmodium malariae]